MILSSVSGLFPEFRNHGIRTVEFTNFFTVNRNVTKMAKVLQSLGYQPKFSYFQCIT